MYRIDELENILMKSNIYYHRSSNKKMIEHIKALGLFGPELLYYPQDFFIEDKKLKLYCFMQNNISTHEFVLENRESRIITKCYPVNAIKKIEFQSSATALDASRLIISLEGGQLILDPEQDTNDDWKFELNDTVLKIYEFLTLQL